MDVDSNSGPLINGEIASSKSSISSSNCSTREKMFEVEGSIFADLFVDCGNFVVDCNELFYAVAVKSQTHFDFFIAQSHRPVHTLLM